jgi:hypothetical protein
LGIGYPETGFTLFSSAGERRDKNLKKTAVLKSGLMK